MSKALVILSGGQDSTTCAAIAKNQFDEVHAITFSYGQRHSVEVQQAKEIATVLDLDSHEIIELGGDILKGTSPLISAAKLGLYSGPQDLPTGVEPTFIYGRNILFLTVAANRAAVSGIDDIFTGVCEADFAGYFDCREVFISLMSQALGEGIFGDAKKLKIHTPLMHLTKAQSILAAQEALKGRFNEVMEMTHTCYAGIKGGCGKCHACIIRDRGFIEAGVEDPIWKFRQ